MYGAVDLVDCRAGRMDAPQPRSEVLYQPLTWPGTPFLRVYSSAQTRELDPTYGQEIALFW